MLSNILTAKHLCGCLFALAFGLFTVAAQAQTLPNAPTRPANTPPGNGSYNYAYQFGLTCGAGASYASSATKPTVQCGGVVVWPGLEFEAGVMGPQATQSAVSGYLTANAWLPLRSLAQSHGVPLLTGGYTRLFETGHALDYGFEYAYPVNQDHSIRFDARDYWTFSNPSQHNIVLRVVWLAGLPD